MFPSAPPHRPYLPPFPIRHHYVAVRVTRGNLNDFSPSFGALVGSSSSGILRHILIALFPRHRVPRLRRQRGFVRIVRVCPRPANEISSISNRSTNARQSSFFGRLGVPFVHQTANLRSLFLEFSALSPHLLFSFG